MKCLNNVTFSVYTQLSRTSGGLKLPHFGNDSAMTFGIVSGTLMIIAAGRDERAQDLHSNNQLPPRSSLILTIVKPLLGTAIVSLIGGFKRFLE